MQSNEHNAKASSCSIQNLSACSEEESEHLSNAIESQIHQIENELTPILERVGQELSFASALLLSNDVERTNQEQRRRNSSEELTDLIERRLRELGEDSLQYERLVELYRAWESIQRTRIGHLGIIGYFAHIHATFPTERWYAFSLHYQGEMRAVEYAGPSFPRNNYPRNDTMCELEFAFSHERSAERRLRLRIFSNGPVGSAAVPIPLDDEQVFRDGALFGEATYVDIPSTDSQPTRFATETKLGFLSSDRLPIAPRSQPAIGEVWTLSQMTDSTFPIVRSKSEEFIRMRLNAARTTVLLFQEHGFMPVRIGSDVPELISYGGSCEDVHLVTGF